MVRFARIVNTQNLSTLACTECRPIKGKHPRGLKPVERRAGYTSANGIAVGMRGAILDFLDAC